MVAPMRSFRVSPIFRRHLPDILAGVAAFAFVVALTGGRLGSAMAGVSSIGADLDGHGTILLLAGALAAMTACNVAFFRHLVRAYMVPRRAAARRSLRSTRSGRP
jgi:hypothetical protein